MTLPLAITPFGPTSQLPLSLAPILPVVTVDKTQSGGTATVTLTIVDKQGRVESVEFRTFDGTTLSAWAPDVSQPYGASVAYTAGVLSYIEWRVIGFDVNDTEGQVLAAGTEHFPVGSGADRLVDLTDVDPSGLANGDVPMWDSGAGLFTMQSPGAASGKHVAGAGWDAGTAALVAASTSRIRVVAASSGTVSAGVVVTKGGPGSATIGIKKCSGAAFLSDPSNLADITGGNDLVVGSAHGVRDTTLTGYTLTVTAGDVFEFQLKTSSSFTQVNATLEYA